MAIPVIALAAGYGAYKLVERVTSGTKAEKWADDKVDQAKSAVKKVSLKKKRSSNGM